MREPTAWLQSETPQPPPPEPSTNLGPEDLTSRSSASSSSMTSASSLTLSATILNHNGFSASAAYNGEEAIVAARDLQPDIVLSDVLMPKMTGIELGIRLRSELPQARMMLFSGQAATSELMRKAHAAGPRFRAVPQTDPPRRTHRQVEDSPVKRRSRAGECGFR